jgi:hypothetical protein
MKNKILLFTSSLTLLITLTLAACSAGREASSEPAPSLPAATMVAAGPTQQTFTDPFAYCAAVGQVDAPDARYSGPQMSDALFKDYLKVAGLDPNGTYPDTFKNMTIWRCMGNKLYACNFGANIPCDSKADTNKVPTQDMRDYCTQSPASSFIPMSVTGHSTIYSWHCVNNNPEILEQIGTVDAAGYESSFWQVVEPVP